MNEYRIESENHCIQGALLSEMRTANPVFFALVIAQAQDVSVLGDCVQIMFSPNHAALKDLCYEKKVWIERMLYGLTGRHFWVDAWSRGE